MLVEGLEGFCDELMIQVDNFLALGRDVKDFDAAVFKAFCGADIAFADEDHVGAGHGGRVLAHNNGEIAGRDRPHGAADADKGQHFADAELITLCDCGQDGVFQKLLIIAKNLLSREKQPDFGWIEVEKSKVWGQVDLFLP